MPLFFDATVSVLHNVIHSRLVSNDSGWNHVPVGGGYSLSGQWALANAGPRRFLNQQGWGVTDHHNDWIIELPGLPLGRLLTTVLANVHGNGHTVVPSSAANRPVLRLLSMNMMSSTIYTDWTVVAEVEDTSATVGVYDSAHYLALTPNAVITSGYRYAIAIKGEYWDNNSENYVIEGVQFNTAFTA